MGLDIYVGTLTRYYAGDWRTTGRRPERSRAEDWKMAAENPRGLESFPGDPARIRPAVLAWKARLSLMLEEYLPRPLEWNEGEDTPYFTERPDWGAYSDLQLWAAYEEQPLLERPKRSVRDWTLDPAYAESTRPGFRSRYSHLLDSVELWLPCEFQPVFAAPDISGRECCIGSLPRLLGELGELNDRTWKAGASALEEWRRQGVPAGASLESGARFAFAVLDDLGGTALAYGLPMKLDY